MLSRQQIPNSKTSTTCYLTLLKIPVLFNLKVLKLKINIVKINIAYVLLHTKISGTLSPSHKILWMLTPLGSILKHKLSIQVHILLFNVSFETFALDHDEVLV